MTQILSIGLRKLRQPRVIAEVLGGILLGATLAPWHIIRLTLCVGPTVFGRIPGFTEHIFPTQSLPYLSLVANIGLCLFLFLVGLEINTAIIRRNARPSLTSPPPESSFRSDSELRSPFPSTINSPIRPRCRTRLSCSSPASPTRSRHSPCCAAF
jgi:hypothetical protein